jgi:hypothetical protein
VFRSDISPTTTHEWHYAHVFGMIITFDLLCSTCTILVYRVFDIGAKCYNSMNSMVTHVVARLDATDKVCYCLVGVISWPLGQAND